MGERGPKKTPTNLAILRGNPGHRPINRSEPQPKAGIPKCPSWLDKDAKKKWRELAPQLLELKLLTLVDGDALANYCQAVSDVKRYTLILREMGDTMTTPNGYSQARPEKAMLDEAKQAVKTFGALFGLSPSARTRLSTGQPAATGNQLMEYAQRGKNA